MRIPTAKTAVAVMLASISLIVTGCSRSSTMTLPTEDSSSWVSPAAPAPGLPPGVTGATALPAEIPNTPSLRGNVTLDACTATKGGWSATGTARNSDDRAVNYTITVFFTTSSATVIETAQVKVAVKPGGTETWTASKKFTAPTTTLCVLRGVG